jgi:hypothetical protein
MQKTYRRSDSGALHLVEQTANLFEVGKMCAVWVKSAFTRSSFRQGINMEFLNTTRVDLEMKTSSSRILPNLKQSKISVIQI